MCGKETLSCILTRSGACTSWWCTMSGVCTSWWCTKSGVCTSWWCTKSGVCTSWCGGHFQDRKPWLCWWCLETGEERCHIYTVSFPEFCWMLLSNLPDIHPTINNDSSDHRIGRSICFCPLYPKKNSTAWMPIGQYVFSCSLIGWNMFWKTTRKLIWFRVWPDTNLPLSPQEQWRLVKVRHNQFSVPLRLSGLEGCKRTYSTASRGLLPFTFRLGAHPRCIISKTGEWDSLTLTRNLLQRLSM